ncbi:MAG TPA: hypothetical protein VFV38_26930 [Ktedonobacteraceae bacterium]|nr:hypothetical protein [Ktedonobacteraceae bacterium]
MSAAQIKEADVSHFECPMCLAIRDITPKGGRVKFPWHPKRTTTTPNQGWRLVKKALMTWELANLNTLISLVINVHAIQRAKSINTTLLFKR